MNWNKRNPGDMYIESKDGRYRIAKYSGVYVLFRKNRIWTRRGNFSSSAIAKKYADKIE